MSLSIIFLVIIIALLGGIIWNLLTWWFSLPSSSTHALVGGLCGATFARSHGDCHAIIWSVRKVKDGQVVMEGVLHKVVIPMLSSPLAIPKPRRSSDCRRRACWKRRPTACVAANSRKPF